MKQSKIVKNSPYDKKQVHTVSRIQQRRQRDTSINYYAKFSRHCVLSGETQRRAFALVPERRNEYI